MASAGLRAFLQELAGTGELVTVNQELSPVMEIAAALRQAGFQPAPALLFERVKGYPGRKIVGNLLGSRLRLAMALGVSEDEIKEEFLRRLDCQVEPQVVPQAPVQEEVHTANIDVTKMVPALVHHQGDAGPYLTCAFTLARDPETGARGMGLHRIQVKGPDRLGIFLATPPLSTFLARAEANNRPLEVAIVIGADPLTLLASVVWAPQGVDKMAVAGGLRQEPVKLVKARTVDLEVPAEAEMVIEGRILPGVREEEGPFGESTGYYFTYENPVIQVTALTMRHDPVYQALLPWTLDEETLIDMAFGVKALQDLRRLVPGIRDLHFVPGTCGSHAVVTVEGLNRAQVREALLQTVLINPQVKLAVAVDPDVNIYDLAEVHWAMATRLQAHQDVMILPGMQGSSIDPSAESAPGPVWMSSKMILDATRGPGEPGKFARITPSPEAMVKAGEIWHNLVAGRRG